MTMIHFRKKRDGLFCPFVCFPKHQVSVW